MPSAAETALKKASQGLTYISETDAPFETFSWGRADDGLTVAKVRKLTKAAARAPVTQVALDEFFGPLTEAHDHSPEEAEDIKKYKGLLQVVNDQLSDATVFKVGKTEQDVYVVGKTEDGEWVGLKTKAVQT
jgi:Nuclease A inhibitor-like protein